MEGNIVGNAVVCNPAQEVRPWSRYWARMFDILIHFLPITIAWVFLHEESFDKIPVSVFTAMVYALWLFLEYFYMSIIGTTLGKKISGIQVLTIEGSKPANDILFKRSYLVWWRGMGIGAGIISIVTNIVAYGNLKKNNITTWDSDLDLVVIHKEIGWFRRLICPAAIIVVILAVILITILEILYLI